MGIKTRSNYSSAPLSRAARLPTSAKGQIIATSHDRFSPNDGLVRESPKISGMKYYSIWPEYIPIGSMYSIFAYIYHKHQPNVGKYTSPMDPMG